MLVEIEAEWMAGINQPHLPAACQARERVGQRMQRVERDIAARSPHIEIQLAV